LPFASLLSSALQQQFTARNKIRRCNNVIRWLDRAAQQVPIIGFVLCQARSVIVVSQFDSVMLTGWQNELFVILLLLVIVCLAQKRKEHQAKYATKAVIRYQVSTLEHRESKSVDRKAAECKEKTLKHRFLQRSLLAEVELSILQRRCVCTTNTLLVGLLF